MIKLLTFMILSIGPLLLAGCEQSSDKATIDLQSYVEKLKQNYIPIIKPHPKTSIQDLPAVTYQASNLREPFSSPSNELSGDQPSKPLQSYPLSSLRFVGTLSKNQIIYAYVMTPDDMIYQIKEGDIIGDHDGRVTHIYHDRINILEQDKDNTEEITQRIVTIWLGKAPS